MGILKSVSITTTGGSLGRKPGKKLTGQFSQNGANQKRYGGANICQDLSLMKVEPCGNTTFGCCPDEFYAAEGPFKEGCMEYKTCEDTR